MKNVKKNTTNLTNERGISLIEVVASIVIIGVVFIAISSLLLQSKKTTVSSETIVDATYIAQQSMEEVYYLTQNRNLQQLQEHYSHQGGTLHKTPTSSDPQLIVELPHMEPNFKVELHFQPLTHTQTQLSSSSTTKLFNIVTTVYEHGQLKSTMENVIEIAL